jgi:hypothetical protein
MLTTKLRKQLEWHFYNRDADIAIYEDKVRGVIESGLTADYDRLGNANKRGGSPTESKAIKIATLGEGRDWAAVVSNTFNAFRFEPEYDVMVALYVNGKRRSKVIEEYFVGGAWQTTFWRWRDKWLETALCWAKEYNLL